MSGALVRAYGRNLVAPPLLGDNIQAQLLLDAAGNLRTTTGGTVVLIQGADADVDVPGVFAISRIVSASEITLAAILALNNNAATRFLHLFDATVVPPNGTAPDRTPLEIPPNGSVSYQPDNSRFDFGLVWVVSLNQATLTISGTPDVWADSFTYAAP